MSMADVRSILQSELCGLQSWERPEVPRNIEVFSRDQVYAHKEWLEGCWKKLCTYWYTRWWDQWVQLRTDTEREVPHQKASDIPDPPSPTNAEKPDVPQPVPFVADVRVKKLQEEITYREKMLAERGDLFGGRWLQQERLEAARRDLAALGPATVILSAQPIASYKAPPSEPRRHDHTWQNRQGHHRRSLLWTNPCE